MPPFFLLTRRTEEGGTGRRRHWGRRPWGLAAAGTEGKRRRGARGIDPPSRFEGWQPIGAAAWRRAVAAPGCCGGGTTRPGGGRKQGQKRGENEGVPTPSSPWAEVPCGVSSTGAGGGRRCSSGRRCWGSKEGARAVVVVCGACGLREESFYRRDEAVEEGRGGGGGRRASRPVLMAVGASSVS